MADYLPTWVGWLLVVICALGVVAGFAAPSVHKWWKNQ